MAAERRKVLHGLSLVGEDLDDLLSLDHLLDVAVESAQCLLLTAEVGAALAADGLDHQQHHQQKGHGDEGQQRIEHQHHDEGGHKGDGVGQEIGKAVADHLRYGVHIVGKAAHHVAGEVGVKIGHGQLLHLVEQFFTDPCHRALGNIHHQAGIDIVAQRREEEHPALQHQHPH